ncbi:MAG: hypothetical protein HUJ25_07755 [Crocinitomicaceae bacterium]|nr:hypothetical protein [Crocinitomicaceae bacterium]
MKQYLLIGCLALLACEGKQVIHKNDRSETAVVELTNPDNVAAPEKPDRSVYINEKIAANVDLKFGEFEKSVYAKVGEEQYKVKVYEGTLMKASGADGGFSLRFSPYDKYDYATERVIKSNYKENLNVLLSKEQNDVLGYVDYTDETNNLAWDYFENLFTVYYYEKEGKNYPLNFVNQGKTEWDG